MINDRDFLMFLCGFYATREGFNGECPYEQLAPSVLGEERGGIEVCIAEVVQDERLAAEMKRLFALARAVVDARAPHSPEWTPVKDVSMRQVIKGTLE